MEKTTKVPVTQRALLQRINRKLAKPGDLEWGHLIPLGVRVVAARGKAINELGAYYLMNGGPGYECVYECDVDLVEKGRALGVLADWEVLDAASSRVGGGTETWESPSTEQK